MSFLTLRGVTKQYGRGRIAALTDINLDIGPGSRTAIVGPSGAGKTTLLRIIAGFDAPDAGTVVLDAETLNDTDTMVPAHRRHIGVVSQAGALFPHLSVAKNVGFGLPRGTPDRKARVLALMHAVQLEASIKDRRPHELSGGQQQRVALARALAQRPKLILLDEPFAALDAGLRESTRKAVAEILSEARITTILVTHDHTEALSFADQIAVLRNGRLMQVSSPRDVYEAPIDEDTAEFLGPAIVVDGRISGGWAVCSLGRIAVDPAKHPGPARIMLRPEQIQLLPVPSEGPKNGARPVLAKVLSTEFAGPITMVTIAIPPSEGRIEVLTVRSTTINTPTVGTEAMIVIAGRAHVFGDGH